MNKKKKNFNNNNKKLYEIRRTCIYRRRCQMPTHNFFFLVVSSYRLSCCVKCVCDMLILCFFSLLIPFKQLFMYAFIFRWKWWNYSHIQCSHSLTFLIRFFFLLTIFSCFIYFCFDHSLCLLVLLFVFM